MQLTVNRLKMAITALSALASLSPAMAQQTKTQLYAYHTDAVVGGCPGLDWHITVEPGGKLLGFVAWDRDRHMARLEGTLNKDYTFEMAAAEVGGAARKATVKGTAGGDYVNISITGSGTACDGLNLPVPRTVGGTQGGGG